MSKRKALPSVECQYTTNCYRKRPDHFESYCHKHIESIIRNGKNNGEYTIPADLNFSRDTVLAQCEIVENLFPFLVSDQQSKKQAMESETLQQKANVTTADMRTTSFEEQEVAEDSIPNNDTASISKLIPRAKDFTPSPKVKPKPTVSTALSISKSDEIEKKRALARNVHEYFDVVAPKGEMAKKLEKAGPYNFFLTTITASKPTHSEPLSVTFMELLDESLGDLESSVQINFMVDISWLMANYYFAGHEYVFYNTIPTL